MKPSHLWFVPILVAAMPFVLKGQSSLTKGDIPGLEQSGFHLYGAAVSSGYLSFSGLANNSSSSEIAVQDYYGWASLSVGYAHVTATSTTAVTYNPSFAGAFNVANSKDFNQGISLQHMRKLKSKWTLYASASANDTSIQQLIFDPASLTQLIAGPAAINGLSQSSSGGIPLSTLQTLVLGSRMLTYQGIAGTSYRASDRLTIRFDGGFAGLEALDNGNLGPLGIVPHSRSEQGDFMLTYALNPRTALIAQATTSLGQSAGAEYDATSFSIGVERKLNQHWFVSAMGGIGIYVPLSQGKDTHATSSYVLNAGAGYKGRAQTWAVLLNKTVGNSYGVAATATYAAQGSWNWSRPGSPWSARAFIGEQYLSGNNFRSFSSFQGSAGVSRSLSRNFSVGLDYAYLEDSSPGGELQFTPKANSARITLAWAPARPTVSAASIPVTNGFWNDGQK